MIIAKCKYSDILTISAIENQCFVKPWTYQMLADTFLSGSFICFTVKDGEKIVAYGGFVHAAGAADITKIAVLPGFRNQKIATKILHEIIKECQNLAIKSITLEVRVSNTAAITLYKNSGFTLISRRHNYYGDEDAYVMQYIFKE